MKPIFADPPRALASCLPTAKQRLLLELCLAEQPAEGRAAWEAWHPGVDLNILERASTRLLPLAYHRLSTFGVQHPEMPRLGGILRHAWADNLTRRHRLAPVLAALDAQGIPHLLLKGAPLAFGVYPNPGARPMDDIDVLVPIDRAREALALLQAQGAQYLQNPLPPPPPAGQPDPLLFKHGCALETATNLHLDLHWFSLADCTQLGADDGFWERRRPLPGFPGAFQLGAEDQVLHLCVHGLRANQEPTIRWIVDVILALRASQAGFDWALLIAEARRRRLIAPVAQAITLLAEQFEVPVPADVITTFRSVKIGWLERTALRGNLKSDILGQFAATWLRYRRATPQRGPGAAFAGFPSYLSHAWGHVSYGKILRHILRRTTRRGQRQA